MGAAMSCSSKGKRISYQGKVSDYESILKECKGKIGTVDESMTSLANSVDILYAAARGLAAFHTEQDDETGTAVISRSKDQHINPQMFYFLKMAVLRDKDFAVTSLQDFLHFVKQAVSQFTVTPNEMFQKLSLDDYQKHSRQTEQAEHLTYGIEQLETENARLKEDKKNLSTHIAVLVDKEKNHFEEIDVLTKENETMKEYKRLIEKKIEKYEQSITKLQSENDTLSRKIQDFTVKESDLRRVEGASKNVHNKMENLMSEMEEIKLENELLNNTAADRNKSTVCLEEELEKKIEETKHHRTEIEKLNNTISRVKLENGKLNSAFIEQKSSISSLKMEIIELHNKAERDENSIAQLRDELEKKIELTKHQRVQIQELKDEYATAKQENDKLNNVIKENEKALFSFKNLDGTAKNLQAENERLQKENVMVKSEIEAEKDKLVDELNTLKSKYKLLEEDTERCKQGLKMKSKQEEIMVQKVQDYDKLLTENKKLKADIMQMEKKVQRIEHRNMSLQESMQTEEKKKEEQILQESQKNKGLVKQVSDLTEEIKRLHGDVECMSNTIGTFKASNKLLQEENYRLDQELERFKRKRVIQVQLYYQRRGELICTVEEELIYLLKSKMESEDNYEVEFIKCLSASDVRPDQPLLLLCISASRIGTDAANTIQGLTLTSKMTLLIFHHKDEHALPSQASCQVLTGQEYKALGGVYDLAFLSGKGIYTCSLNEGSSAKIVHFIKTEGVAV